MPACSVLEPFRSFCHGPFRRLQCVLPWTVAALVADVYREFRQVLALDKESCRT